MVKIAAGEYLLKCHLIHLLYNAISNSRGFMSKIPHPNDLVITFNVYYVFLPVALPSMDDGRICDTVLICLFIQKIKEILDGERQGIIIIQHEDGRHKVVYKLVQDGLVERRIRARQIAL